MPASDLSSLACCCTSSVTFHPVRFIIECTRFVPLTKGQWKKTGGCPSHYNFLFSYLFRTQLNIGRNRHIDLIAPRRIFCERAGTLGFNVAKISADCHGSDYAVASKFRIWSITCATSVSTPYLLAMSYRFHKCASSARSCTHSRETMDLKRYERASTTVARIQALVEQPVTITVSLLCTIKCAANAVPKNALSLSLRITSSPGNGSRCESISQARTSHSRNPFRSAERVLAESR